MKRKIWKRTGALLAVLLLAAAFCGCGTAQSGQPEVYYAFEDDLGNQVTLSQKPEKVAVLFSSFADIWQMAGGEVAITVGESVKRGFVGEEALLVDDGAGQSIDTELLVSYEPDFVVCSADLEAQAEAAKFLNEAGIPCAAFHVESFAEYLKTLKTCTEITGDPAAYETYGAEVEQQVNEVLHAAEEKVAQMGGRNFLFIRAGTKYSSTRAKTAENNFVCVMLEELGMTNVVPAEELLLEELSVEHILLSNPDYIFFSTIGDDTAAKAYMNGVLAQPEWQSQDAVQNGRYTYLPKELFHYKPNARWADAYQYLVDLLYPSEG